jgi:hypothetical protein
MLSVLNRTCLGTASTYPSPKLSTKCCTLSTSQVTLLRYRSYSRRLLEEASYFGKQGLGPARLEGCRISFGGVGLGFGEGFGEGGELRWQRCMAAPKRAPTRAAIENERGLFSAIEDMVDICPYNVI